MAIIWKYGRYSPFAWLHIPRILLIAAAFGIAGCKYFFRRGRGESQELRFSGVSGQADKLGVTHIQPAVEAFVEKIELRSLL